MKRWSLVSFSSAVLVALAAALTLSSGAHAGLPPGDLVAAKRALQGAVDLSESKPLLAARAKFDALRAADPSSAEALYWIAVADWRVVPILSTRDKDKKAAKRQVEAGLAAIDEAIRKDPNSAEAHALKAGLLGLSIGFGNPMAAMTVGPKIASAEQKSLELAPKNPRVKLLQAIGTLHKPGFVGGGADKAMPLFEEAIALFAAETVADPTAPDWGRDDAQAWAGRCAMKLEKAAEARAYYQKALEINPNNGWVRHALLPAAEKAVAGRTDRS